MATGQNMTSDDIIKRLLNIRGLTTTAKTNEFFNPIYPDQIKSPFDSQPAIKLINKHIKAKNKIAVYGDYDVDGICSTAILWETLYSNYKDVFPHIPHRESEGYGLTTAGIDHCLKQNAKLIIAVDNGIVAHEQVDYCKENSCDIIIIDHHEPEKKLPQADVILHSTSCCAAGLSWFFGRDYSQPNLEHLSLAAIATICDLVPLLGVNRSFAKYGLEELNKTQRPGLLSLFELSRITPGQIGSYHVGFIIGPRLNAMGRLEHAIDSLRLLCTPNVTRARELAQTLNLTNQRRQTETNMSITHAIDKLADDDLKGVLLSADSSYHQGVIGLIASKMVENYHRPSIAISIGEEVSKGSGRSVTGFHLTNFLRKHKDLFIDLGGHSMACGFSIPTDKIDDLSKVLSQADIDPQLLVKEQRVDMDIPLTAVTMELFSELERFQPFGLGNPTPVFSSEAQVTETRTVGKEGKHLKFKAGGLDAIWFNAANPPTASQSAKLAYSVGIDRWNGQENIQLLVKAVT